MTGAPLPQGCDCVIPFEDVKVEGNQADLVATQPRTAMEHVHRQASDRRRGELLLPCGCILGSPQIAIITAVGKTKVMVGARPGTALISTGDELVKLGNDVTPYQSRPSNSYGMQAALRRLGLQNIGMLHSRDDRKHLDDILWEAMNNYDMLILTGGVSAGKYDFVPAALKAAGVETVFHKVSQRPGKPLFFGLSRDKKPVFGLPGNPVATLVCLHRYILPSIRQSMGARPLEIEFAKLSQEIVFDKPMTFFPPVSARCGSDGRLTATPVRYSGSGDYASLAESDGFVELPLEINRFPAGTAVRFHRWSV
jgi:molybdopterin molybdotransferase